MSIKLHAALGFELEANTNWESIIPPPKKPSNWKQETFDAKLAELRASQEKDAAETVVAGRVRRLAVRFFYTEITDTVKRYMTAISLPDDRNIIATKAIIIDPKPEVLVQAIREHNSVPGIANCTLYGADIKNKLRILCMSSYDHFSGAVNIWNDLDNSPTHAFVINRGSVQSDLGYLLSYDEQRAMNIIDILTVMGARSIATSALDIESKIIKQNKVYSAVNEADACARLVTAHHLPFSVGA